MRCTTQQTKKIQRFNLENQNHFNVMHCAQIDDKQNNKQYKTEADKRKGPVTSSTSSLSDLYRVCRESFIRRNEASWSFVVVITRRENIENRELESRSEQPTKKHTNTQRPLNKKRSRTRSHIGHDTLRTLIHTAHTSADCSTAHSQPQIDWIGEEKT